MRCHFDLDPDKLLTDFVVSTHGLDVADGDGPKLLTDFVASTLPQPLPES